MNFMTIYFTELPHFKPPAQRRPDRLHNISQISLPAGLDVWSESWSAGGVERSIPHPPVSQRSRGTTVWIYRASHCTMVLAHCRICKLVLKISLFYTVLFENNICHVFCGHLTIMKPQQYIKPWRCHRLFLDITLHIAKQIHVHIKRIAIC